VLGDSHWSNFFPSGYYLSFVWSQLGTGHGRNSFFRRSCRTEYTNPVFYILLFAPLELRTVLFPACRRTESVGKVHCSGAEEHRASYDGFGNDADSLLLSSCSY
jgi:hypothetical protein